jgi:hypothetical protein
LIGISGRGLSKRPRSIRDCRARRRRKTLQLERSSRRAACVFLWIL